MAANGSAIFAPLRTMVNEGSSADRQLATFEKTGDLSAVVDGVCAETVEGL